MPAYLVRYANDKVLVGVYCVENKRELIDLVDEEHDPHHCEYKRLPSGGLYWEQGKSAPMPLSPENAEARGPFGLPIEPPQFTEGWFDAFCTDSRGWRTLATVFEVMDVLTGGWNTPREPSEAK
ncbi:MAG: hypothetical protein RO009_15765 [Pseudorhodoplanes sp.]|jgi:hypothetical protein|nr:hypothetical protein [Pseudorhodoplanes sp.]